MHSVDSVPVVRNISISICRVRGEMQFLVEYDDGRLEASSASFDDPDAYYTEVRELIRVKN